MNLCFPPTPRRGIIASARSNSLDPYIWGEAQTKCWSGKDNSWSQFLFWKLNRFHNQPLLSYYEIYNNNNHFLKHHFEWMRVHPQFCRTLHNRTETIMYKLSHDSGMSCSQHPISQRYTPLIRVVLIPDKANKMWFFSQKKVGWDILLKWYKF